MCGIVGKFQFKNILVEKQLIEKMCESIIHRGPDNQGIYLDENIGIGMRRLSIIDLDGGNQPFLNSDKTISVVFNGEIYNYKEVKKNLTDLGYEFLTNSDTEVLLHGYQEFGHKILNKLNGMFSMAVYDKTKKELFLARDRIGIKPLYYYYDDEKFLFGSEIKAILEDKSISREIDREALDLFLSYGYVPSPKSMFKNIYKVDPGHFLTVSKKGISKNKYWDINFEKNQKKSKKEFLKEFQELFRDSVKKRLLSDVPVGAFLSGGIDSSAIVGEMSNLTKDPIKTFSIGFKEGGYHDETKYAEKIAKKFKTDHLTFKVGSNIIELINMYVHHFDEPFADYAAFPTYVVSKLAKEHVSVVLTGDGADEVFGGYRRYKMEYYFKYYRKIPRSIRLFLIANFLKLFIKLTKSNSFIRKNIEISIKRNKESLLSFKDSYVSGFTLFDNSLKSKILLKNNVKSDYSLKFFNKDWNKNLDFIERRLLLDQKNSLPENMLTKVDRVSMAVSLEARVPFLDHRIVELAASIPLKYKIRKYDLKYFLKESFKDLLPESIIKRKKHGFSSPIDKWIRTDLKDFMLSKLSNEKIKEIGLFCNLELEKLLKEHIDGKKNYGHFLFMVLLCQEWVEKWEVKV